MCRVRAAGEEIYFGYTCDKISSFGRAQRKATPASGEGDSVSEATAAAQTETSSDVQVTVRNMEPEDGRDVLDGYGLHPFRQAQVKVKWHDIMDAY